ncbi:hypothetical protein MANI_006393 [Metarhizium anisopliae]
MAAIYRYQNKRKGREGALSDVGMLTALTLTYKRVKANQHIQLVLPAFPFKSPNTRVKVLGRLPDKAEEFALAHLNGLCASIKDIYEPGAMLTIISDGIVYNDLLSIPDSDVWNYGQTLRALARDKGYNHIQFSRLSDLVSSLAPSEDEVSYVANATNFRLGLLGLFKSQDWDVNDRIANEEDVRMTYRGYIKFLNTDLEGKYPVGGDFTKTKFKKGTERIAKQMLIRGHAFARAVRERFGDHVRLSIHPSTGQNKVSISTLPTETTFTTPWHCALGVRLDGTTTTGLAQTFRNDPTWELVYENDRPSYFREKSDLWHWESGEIICTPLYPAGVMIQPKAGPNKLSMREIDANKVRALAEHVSPVILRNFGGTQHRERYIEKAHEFGTPLPWKFGLLLEVKDRGADSRGLNNVLSAEWMPFHFDGLFKTEDRLREDGSTYKYPVPPRFQLFTAVTSSPPDTGFTLFSTSTQVFSHLPESLPVETLRKLSWSVRTTSFEGTKLDGLPLIEDHPTTGKLCLRYHEPWPASKTAFEATLITIDGLTEEVSYAICNELNALLHDRRVAYWHAWQRGDMLVSDNVLTMHTRSDFQGGSDRELWRIHFD